VGASKEFLMDCIADATVQLLREKPLEKLTADEICKLAGIGRATYFRHFHSKKNILLYKRWRLWQEHFRERSIAVKERFFIGNAKVFFEFMTSNREFYQLLYATGNWGFTREYFEYLIDTSNLAVEERYRERVLFYALSGIVEEWAINGFCETAEELQEIFLQMFRSLDKLQGSGKTLSESNRTSSML